MTDIFRQAGHTLATLTRQVEEIRQVVETRQRQLMALERQVDLSEMDVEAFQHFLRKPYLLRHLSDDRYELLIPRFLAAGFHPGWPLGTDGEYLRFAVSKLIHLITPLPDWLLDELGYRPPDFQGYVQNDRLFITAGDPGEMWQRLGGKKTFSSRRGGTSCASGRNRATSYCATWCGRAFSPTDRNPSPRNYCACLNPRGYNFALIRLVIIGCFWSGARWP